MHCPMTEGRALNEIADYWARGVRPSRKGLDIRCSQVTAQQAAERYCMARQYTGIVEVRCVSNGIKHKQRFAVVYRVVVTAQKLEGDANGTGSN